MFHTPLSPPRNLGVLSLDEKKEAVLFDTPFPDVRAATRPVSTGGGTRPLWRQDGRELFYYVEPGTIMAVPIRRERT